MALVTLIAASGRRDRAAALRGASRPQRRRERLWHVVEACAGEGRFAALRRAQAARSLRSCLQSSDTPWRCSASGPFGKRLS